MHIVRLALVAALALAAASPPVAAQAASSARVAGAPVASQLSVGVRKSLHTPAPAGKPVPFRQDTKQNRALMIVGGAGMLTGAVIGGDAGSLISVSGAVVFLWGLYQFLQ